MPDNIEATTTSDTGASPASSSALDQRDSVDVIVERALQGSSMAQKFSDAIKAALKNNGFTTLGLVSSMNAEGCKLITDEATTGSENAVRDTALVLSSLTSMIREAKQELEVLYQAEMSEERIKNRKATLDLSQVIHEAQNSLYTLSIGPNLIGPVAAVKKVVDQPLAYVELNDFLLPSHAYDADVETLTTITGEVVQRRKSDGKKQSILNVGEWNQCFLRYAVALQLSPTGRSNVDLGALMSYMAQVSVLLTCHAMSVVFDAEASYRRSGAMSIAAGTTSMSELFGSEAYVRPRLDMEINIAYNHRYQEARRWQNGKGFGKGKGGKGKGKGTPSAKGKGKGKGRMNSFRSEPYHRNDKEDDASNSNKATGASASAQ